MLSLVSYITGRICVYIPEALALNPGKRFLRTLHTCIVGTPTIFFIDLVNYHDSIMFMPTN
jgi:hypothetical protein